VEDYASLGAAADVARLEAAFRAAALAQAPLRAASARLGTSAHWRGRAWLALVVARIGRTRAQDRRGP